MDGQEAAYRSVIATTPDAIVTMDEAGRILFANPAAERMFGYSAEELEGEPLTMLMPERFRGQHEGGFRRYLATGIPNLEWSLVRLPGLHRDGREIPLSISFGEYREGERKIFTGILRNISDQVRREAGLRFLLKATEVLTASLDYERTLQTVAELATHSIADWAAVDLIEEGHVHRVAIAHPDPAKLQIAKDLEKRYPPNPASTTGVHHVIRTGQRMLISEISEEMIQGVARDAEHLRLLRDLHFSSYMSVPLEVRDVAMGALTFVSSTPSRRFTDEDADLAAELARRAAIAIDNARLFRAAESARLAAESANAAKSEFLAMMSHELRTPLNAIAGYAELLAVGVRGELTKKQLADVRSIQRSQAHLLAIINDILNFAKLEAGRVQFEYVEAKVNALLGGLEELIRPQLSRKGVRYRFSPGDPNATTWVDEEKFQQIMLNLLTNAIKYTAQGGLVRLEWEIAGSDFVVRVSDTGSGIPPDKFDTIFDPFVQVEQRRIREQAGAGLGLAISRDIARQMGGDISVESRLGKGSTFTVRLPRARRSSEPSGTPADSPS